MQILHETMSMPMVVKRIAGKIGSVRRSTVAIQNDYKTFKQATKDYLKDYTMDYTIDYLIEHPLLQGKMYS